MSAELVNTGAPRRRDFLAGTIFFPLLWGFVGLIVVLVYSVLPESFLILIGLYFVLSVLAQRYPKFPLYYTIIILTLVKVFIIQDFAIYRGSLGTGYRFAPSTHPVLQYADELATLVLLQSFLIKTRFLSKIPPLLKDTKVVKGLAYFMGIAVISALINWVPAVNLLYFFANWYRPFLVFAYALVIPWNGREIRSFANFLLVLAFVFQWAGSLAMNWPKLVDGELFWIDDFTGTFMFPLCEWAAFLLSIAMTMFLAQFAVRRQIRYIVLGGLAFFGILSAQVGTMTVLLLLVMIIFWGGVFLAPAKLGLHVSKSRIPLVAGLVSLATVIGTVWFTSETGSWQSFTFSYAEQKLEERVLEVVSIRDIPKVLAYINLGNEYFSGEINPVWGAGPAMYLTSTGSALNTSPLVERFSAGTLFSGREELGQAESQNISLVGLAGELGVLGLVVYIGVLLAIYGGLWKQREELYGTDWHGLLVGSMGCLAFLLAYAAIQSAFDSWIHVTYNLSFCAVLLIVSRSHLSDQRQDQYALSYQPWEFT